MGLTSSPAGEWAGFALLLIAVVLAVTATIPGRHELPMSRRRPDVPPPDGALSRVGAGASAAAGRLMSGRGSDLQEALALAGIRAEARDVVVLLGSSTVIAFAVGLIAVNGFLGILLAILVPVGFWVWLKARSSKRRAHFSDQLPQVLQMLASSLRAGSSLPQAMQVVAAESEEPTRIEFTRVGNELRVGRPMAAALDDVARRMESQDFAWVAQAVMINREVGGNLADVLDGVSTTMRERAALRRQVDALSAEGRMSGWILMALPIGVFLLMYITNPTYFGPLLSSPLGWVLIAAAVLLLIVGAFWLNAMVKVKY